MALALSTNSCWFSYYVNEWKSDHETLALFCSFINNCGMEWVTWSTNIMRKDRCFYFWYRVMLLHRMMYIELWWIILLVSPQGSCCIIFVIFSSLFCVSLCSIFFLCNWSRCSLAQPAAIWTWTCCNLSLAVALCGGPHGGAVPWATLLDFIAVYRLSSLACS